MKPIEHVKRKASFLRLNYRARTAIRSGDYENASRLAETARDCSYSWRDYRMLGNTFADIGNALDGKEQGIRMKAAAYQAFTAAERAAPIKHMHSLYDSASRFYQSHLIISAHDAETVRNLDEIPDEAPAMDLSELDATLEDLTRPIESGFGFEVPDGAPQALNSLPLVSNESGDVMTDIFKDVEKQKKMREKGRETVNGTPDANLNRYQRHIYSEGLIPGTFNYLTEGISNAWQSYRSRAASEPNPASSGMPAPKKSSRAAGVLASNVKKRLGEGKSSRYLAAKAELAYWLDPSPETAESAADANYAVFRRTERIPFLKRSSDLINDVHDSEKRKTALKGRLDIKRRKRFTDVHLNVVYRAYKSGRYDQELVDIACANYNIATRPDQRVKAATVLGYIAIKNHSITKREYMLASAVAALDSARDACGNDTSLLETTMPLQRRIEAATKKSGKKIK